MHFYALHTFMAETHILPIVCVYIYYIYEKSIICVLVATSTCVSYDVGDVCDHTTYLIQ
jgi:hypothetical protein